MTPSALMPVVVDQDGGVDDALALLVLAGDPHTTIAGVGSVHGNVEADAAAHNALRALELAGDDTTPVARGAATPLDQALHLAHPEDLLRKIAGPPRRGPSGDAAVDQLLRLAHMYAGDLQVLTLGPLTNLAQAVQADPDLPRLVRRVVTMGGAYRVRGNSSEVAESNIWHDPEAADIVLGAGFEDLTLVPLDVTRQVTVTRLYLNHLVAAARGVRSRLAKFLLRRSTPLPSFPIHDVLAGALLLDRTMATYDRSPLAVELAGPERGRIRAARAGQRTPVDIAVEVDTSSVFPRLAGVLRQCLRAAVRQRTPA